MPITEAYRRDANSVPITNNGLIATKAITYAAATTGATGATTLFTVTGTVAVRVFGVVSGANLTGSGTLEVGVAGATALILAQTAGTDLDIGQIWIDNAPALVENLPDIKVVAGKNIIQTIGTDTITAGTITYYCLWNPLSEDGSVVAA